MKKGEKKQMGIKHKYFLSWKAKAFTYTGFPQACYVDARFPKDKSHVRSRVQLGGLR